MLNFDFSTDSGYIKPYRIIELNFTESDDLVFGQQIKLALLVNQVLTQKLLQKETLSQSIKPVLNLNQSLIKGFNLTANTKLEVKVIQEFYKGIIGYGKALTLFNEPLPIEQISLTFDQLGRPLVFYRVGENTLKLYWYDPVAQQNVLTNFGVGKDPTACFDFPQDTGQSFTDALLFYVRDDQVFMRIQRDRYAIEYPCPAIQPGLKINSAGLRVDNRLQVVYQFSDNDYEEPTEIPVVVIPEDETGDTEIPVVDPEEPVEIIQGRYFYNNDINSCLKTNFNINPFFDYFKISFNIKNDLSDNLQYVFGCLERRELFCAFYKYQYSNSSSKYFINLWKAGGENNIALNVTEITGNWVFEFLGNNGNLVIKKDNQIIYNGLAANGFNRNKLVNLSINGVDQNYSNSLGFKGITHEWVIETETKLERFPINTYGKDRQNSVSQTDFVTIKNHKISSWFLEKI